MSSGITERSTRMNEYVSDTMAFILRLELRKLHGKVKSLFEQAEQKCPLLTNDPDLAN